MGAHKKTGSMFFPLDTSFFSDRKISRLKAAHGAVGVLVYIYLLCEIYRSGYYIELNDDLILDISDELNISVNETRQIIEHLLSRSLFDNTLAKSVKILTATSVQFRYQDMVKGRALKNPVWVNREFWLLSKEETQSFIKVYPKKDNSENYCNNSKNYTDNSEKNAPKRKKEKKEINELKECTAASRFCPPTLEEIKAFCQERGNGIDAEHFYSYYTANGWVQGKGKPIKDWKAVVITWEKNGFNSGGNKRDKNTECGNPGEHSYDLSKVKDVFGNPLT